MINALGRSLLFWILFIGLLFGTGMLVSFVPQDWSRLAQGILWTVSAFFLIWIFLKNEKRSFRDIGLTWNRGTIGRFLIGIVIGTVLMAILLLLLLSFTDLQLIGNSNKIQVSGWVYFLVVIFFLAFMEELAFRSYPLLKLNDAWGIWWAQFITALVFAVYHIVIGWEWVVAFFGPFIWSFVFGLAALWSRGIAMPTGIHMALNVLQVFTGMKADELSYWKLDYKKGNSIDPEAKALVTGLGIQLLILVLVLSLTGLFTLRNKRKSQTIK